MARPPNAMIAPLSRQIGNHQPVAEAIDDRPPSRCDDQAALRERLRREALRLRSRA